ncbi:glycosyltransferase [Lacihabitans sp. CS3-21]|uniref:glycosyltransferase n=1 Tax=Lacihabitans sp. CS3-21 TaxID=2487332 RepID=UPI0020CF8111|nr:glycosyltransferase [Lacihabitans sp. CS3-21]MCP9746806.1 glycosyltransferase [Lacihabitans sp. CS3-21]
MRKNKLHNFKYQNLQGGHTFDFGKNEIELKHDLPEILFVTSFPPRECGIATYSQDLIKSLKNKFLNSFNISICALESDNEKHKYQEEIKFKLNTDLSGAFANLAKEINLDKNIATVMIQHEFGFFAKREFEFQQFLVALEKPIVLGFHTVLPNPNISLRFNVNKIAAESKSIVVMTKSSMKILVQDYGISEEKIVIIPHGTHLVEHLDKDLLKLKYDLKGKKVLSTFGLLSSGKSIETTINALPAIIKVNKNVMFLIIGKTHPSVFNQEGEKYRNMLQEKVTALGLKENVRFVNYFLPLPDLLEYLQLTDIYLFTSKDPNQAVSGTFSYAISCGCPIVSTPIPHAMEVLKDGAGVIVDFGNPPQLSKAINKLLKSKTLRKNISSVGLHSMAPTAWENAAIGHARLFQKVAAKSIDLEYKMPEINLNYLKKLTTEFGMIQFSIINEPDINSGYTLDDNARAMVAMCMHYEKTNNHADLAYIKTYLNFITFCLQSNSRFLNYVDESKQFTEQNQETNLEDSNGRAIWALGYLTSHSDILPQELVLEAENALEFAISNVLEIYSSRAMAFTIKGLYYRNKKNKNLSDIILISQLSNRLVQMFLHESEPQWNWFEGYLTYGNSILPEALLCAYLITDEPIYREIAKTSFDFLLSKIFTKNTINVISNNGWLHRGEETKRVTVGGEQAIDIAYTIMALEKFTNVFEDEQYQLKMEIAFSWFLGNNHLHQIIYNPSTGGCYDGLEDTYININQGAESTVSYLMARLTMEKGILENIIQPKEPKKIAIKYEVAETL